MYSLVNYPTTGANALKNLGLMTISAPTKLSIKKDYRFRPFHDIFINYIKNMGWLIYLVFTESGTDYNISNDFCQVKLETIKTE